MKKHFLFITNLLPPACDGVGDHTVFLAKALHRAGHTVSILTRQQPIDESITVFARVFRVEAWRGKLYKEKILGCIVTAKPDWVIVQYVPYSFDRIGLPFFLPGLVQKIGKLGIPVAVWFHEIAIRYQFSFKYAAIAFGQRWIAHHLASRAKLVITSIDLYGNMLRRHSNKLTIIPSGANLDIENMYAKNSTTTFSREEIAPKTNRLIVVFGKREIRFFLPIFQELQSQFPGLGLLLIGNHFKNQLSQNSFSNIIIHDYLPSNRLIEFLSIGDIGFLPDPVNNKGKGGSSNKSGSLAAMLAAGLPVIGTRGDMNNHLLKHGKNIWLLQNLSREIVLNDFTLLLKDEEYILPIIKEKGIQLYQDNLHWDKIVQLFQKSISKIS